MKIEYYTSNNGIYFRVDPLYCTQFYVNGTYVSSLPKYAGKFYRLDATEITSVEQNTGPKIIRVGYELIDQSLACDKIPSKLSLEQLDEEWNDAADEFVFSGEYATIASLYKVTTVQQDGRLVPLEHELVHLGNLIIENVNEPEKTTVRMSQDDGFSTKKPTEVDLASIVSYDDLIRLVVPEFMLHNHACALTSAQVYKIVRQHIIENIDPKVAVITSNYDFCFTVEKKVTTKPYDVKREKYTPRGNSYKPPKFYTEKKTTKRSKIFEMTWAGYKGNGGYGEYTCIDPWKADSLAAMKDQMETYLSDLMKTINAPTHECEHCSGLGVTFDTVKTNDRKL